MWNGNSYSTTATATTIFSGPYIVSVPSWSSNSGGRFRSKRERELDELLRKFELSALEVRLRRRDANKKAMLDAKSRQRRVPHVNAQKGAHRLQTYSDALASRQAARRTA